MSDEPNIYENEKFEEENPNPNPEPTSENRHRMRLSIDIHSLKEAEFRGLIYVRYSSIQSIGIKQFKTLPAIEVLKPTEGKLLVFPFPITCFPDIVYMMKKNSKTHFAPILLTSPKAPSTPNSLKLP